MTTEADHSLAVLPFALLSSVWGSLAAELRLDVLPSQMPRLHECWVTGVYCCAQPFVLVLLGEQIHRSYKVWASWYFLALSEVTLKTTTTKMKQSKNK